MSKQLSGLWQIPSADSSRSSTPAHVATPITLTSLQSAADQGRMLTAGIGEQLLGNYQVHELPSDSTDDTSDYLPQSHHSLPETSKGSELVLNTALLARIEALEAENQHLKKELKTREAQHQHFRISQVRDNNKLFRFFTGFASYMHFLALFEFLGPVVNELNYWGSKETSRRRHRTCKLDPENQMFLTVVKLRLNLKFQDLAFRFGISQAVASRYFTTWTCFLYHHLKELDWVPSVQQITGTLPHSFMEKYPSTYAIIDGSEIFIETPSDLHMQSSTWSQYKHHNTAKFLVACSPNGGITYVSPLYVGSISDIELTRISGFLTTLQDKPGVSIMADRGFTIKDMLSELNVELNIPPFMEGRRQLPAQEIQVGRTIASLRIHVERAIGRIKNYSILQGTLPISMARLSNQIVCVCAFLSNFQPALVPPLECVADRDVEEYFQSLATCTSGSDYEGDDETSSGED